MKTKLLLFILGLALILRLPIFLTRNEPTSDELGYFLQSVNVFNKEDLSGNYIHGNRDKIFFVLLQAPIASLVFSLTDNPALSASFFPFIASLLFVFLFYHFARKLYGKEVAYWAGLLCAVLPYLAVYSSSMMSHTFFIYLFVAGAYLLFKYLENRRLLYLLLACVTLASLGRIRIEGFGVYSLAVLVLFYEHFRSVKSGNRELLEGNFISVGLILVLSPVCVYLSGWLISEILFVTPAHPPDKSFILGKILGYLSYKMLHMFDIQLPGGFLASNKIEYIVNNIYLIPLTLLIILFDTLKTIFILPVRVIPPLFFLFLGAVFTYNAPVVKPQTRIIEKIFLLSLLTILAYPLLMFLSHSRFAYLYVPVLLLFMAKGAAMMERYLREKYSSRISFLSPRILISTIILLYLFSFHFILLVPIYKNRHKSESFNPVIEWVNHEFGTKNISIMSLKGLPFNLNHTPVGFPIRITRDERGWGYSKPVSLEETINILRQQDEALMILSESQLEGKSSDSKSRFDYFQESFNRIMGFNDERLELMRPEYEYKISKDLFSEFSGLVDGSKSVQNLTLIKTISTKKDTFYLFLFES